MERLDIAAAEVFELLKYLVRNLHPSLPKSGTESSQLLGASMFTLE
jgi:hypothetical protein